MSRISACLSGGLRGGLRGAADALASLLFPAPCRICGQTLQTASRAPVCAACLSSLSAYTGAVCEQCGRPVVSQAGVVGRTLCLICRRDLYHFDFARSYGLYTPVMASAVMLLKYHHVLPLAQWLAGKMVDVALQQPELRTVDIVIPVPQHRLRQRERGYNQAELLARPLARRLGLPCRTDLLVRIRPRPDKLRLTVRERWRTVRGAYAVRAGAKVDNLRLLLIDDVFTTGATLDACSQTLYAAGASYVAALTAARAQLRGQPVAIEPLQEPNE